MPAESRAAPKRGEKMEMFENSRFYRQKAVMEKLGVSRATVNRWVKDGSLPAPLKIGARAIAWPGAVLNQWADKIGAGG